MAGEFDINLSNGTVLATLYPLEVNGPDNRSTPRLVQNIQIGPDAFVLNGDLTYRFQYFTFTITGVDDSAEELVVLGDKRFYFKVDRMFVVTGSTGNDGTYTVASDATYNSNTDETTISVNENITDSTVDGSIGVGFPFEVQQSITKSANDIDTSTDQFFVPQEHTALFNTGKSITVKQKVTKSIVSVNVNDDEIIISNDHTALFTNGKCFEIKFSTGNDGTYTVNNSSYDSGNDQTIISVVENISSSISDGNITTSGLLNNQTYTIDNSSYDSGNDQTTISVVENIVEHTINGTATTLTIDGLNAGTYTVNSSLYDECNNQTTILINESISTTSSPYGQIVYAIEDDRSTLKLPGKGTINYGESLIEDLVRMTENFAGPDSPDTNTNITGGGPSAQPLTGQQWYNTDDDTFYRYDGTQWTNNVNVDTSSLTLTDAEDGNKVIHLTGTEGTLPSPWSGNASDEQPGAVLWPESNPPNNDPLFRVLSTDASERLRIEHNSNANSGYIRTINNLDVQAKGESYFYGQVGIGDNGLPTIDRTLTVEGNGIAVNAPGSQNANITLDSPIGQTSTLVFETQNVARGEIVVDDTVSGTPIQLNPTSGNGVQSFGRVGINNAPPSGNVWLEVTGDIQANSQFFGSDQTAADPTYSFTSDPDTGLFLSQAGVLSLSAGGSEILQVRADTGTVRLVGTDIETTLTDVNDVPNRKYVDDKVQSISWREPVRVRDTTQRTDSSAFPTTGTIDGVTLNDGDRVLFSLVTTVADRDIWTWNAGTTSWTRTENTGTPEQVRTVGDIVYVMEGTDAGSIWSYNANDDWELVISRTALGVNVVFETQTASSDGQQVFTLANEYVHGGDNLIVFVNGQKKTLDQFYNETGSNEITVIAPSPIVTGDRVDFYIIAPNTSSASNFQRETQTGLTGTPTVTLNSITYVVGSENLLVYLNGQKMIRGTNYTETSSTSIDWLSPTLDTNDTLELYSSVPVVAGRLLQDIANVQSTPQPTDGQFLRYNSSAGRWEYQNGTGSIDVQDDTITAVSGALTLNFGTSLDVTDNGGGTATIDVTGGGGGTTAWGDITGTLSDQTDLQTALDNKLSLSGGTMTGTLTSQDIIPEMTGATGDVSTRTLGTATAWFAEAYIDELFVGPNSLYVNGKKVIEDVSDTITITTSPDQSLAIGTTGIGDLNITSEDLIDITGDGGLQWTVPATQSNKHLNVTNESLGGNITFTATGSSSQVQFSAVDEIDLTATTIDINGTVVLSGDPSNPLEAATKQYVDNNINTISSIDDLSDVDTTTTAPSDGDVLTWNNANSEWEPQAPSGGGGVSSSTGTSTDNALVRYDGTTGNTIQQSGIVVDDNDNISGHGQSISFETADFTLAASQAGRVLDCNKGSAFTVTVPTNASVPLPVGYTVSLVQSGSGTVTISGQSGVTIQTISTTDLNGQWAAATLYKRQTDEWVLIGDIA